MIAKPMLTRPWGVPGTLPSSSLFVASTRVVKTRAEEKVKLDQEEEKRD